MAAARVAKAAPLSSFTLEEDTHRTFANQTDQEIINTDSAR